jgi:anti-sigma regulatory factor (Ser/Thr protein kinase)/serine/threonine protein phosphatase PrpC
LIIKDSIAISITEETHVAACRRAAADLCRRLGLSDATVARAELIVVELAGNILHHAERGHVLLGPTALGHGLQIIAADLGPGLGDLERAMADGYSTRTTPGLGRGVVRRQAGALDVYSRTDAGSVLSTTVCDEPGGMPFEAAVVSTHLEGETVNGDSWAIYPASAASPDRTVFLMVDGLGHGHFAAEAAAVVLRVADTAMAADPTIPLTALLQRMNAPMTSTRGAAVMLISASESKVLCSGIGNISAALCGPDGGSHNLVSHNGTVGHRMPRVQEFESPLTRGTLLVMHSDGISARWKLSQYPGLVERAPATVAGVLYRDAARGRDDASVLVARLPAGAGTGPEWGSRRAWNSNAGADPLG